MTPGANLVGGNGWLGRLWRRVLRTFLYYYYCHYRYYYTFYDVLRRTAAAVRTYMHTHRPTIIVCTICIFFLSSSRCNIFDLLSCRHRPMGPRIRTNFFRKDRRKRKDYFENHVTCKMSDSIPPNKREYSFYYAGIQQRAILFLIFARFALSAVKTACLTRFRVETVQLCLSAWFWNKCQS